MNSSKRKIGKEIMLVYIWRDDTSHLLLVIISKKVYNKWDHWKVSFAIIVCAYV